jgi:hypothetical protein
LFVIGQLKKIFSKTIWPNKFKFGRSTYGRFCIKFLPNKMTGSDHLASSYGKKISYDNLVHHSRLYSQLLHHICIYVEYTAWYSYMSSWIQSNLKGDNPFHLYHQNNHYYHHRVFSLEYIADLHTGNVVRNFFPILNLLSSLGRNDHVSFSHHLASVVCLLFTYFVPIIQLIWPP